jgi:cyclopropane fatty-acyl-phospholipid synthase-like methyltransferase
MNYLLLKYVKENFNEPRSALDLGCGDGHDIKSLSSLGWEVKGVGLPKVDLNKPYKSNKKYDLVYSIAVLQFIKNKDVFIDTCYNNLKQNGKLFLLTFDKSDRTVHNYLTKKQITDLLKYNFKKIKIDKLKIKDNHEPLGSHEHVVLLISAIKKTSF